MITILKHLKPVSENNPPKCIEFQQQEENLILHCTTLILEEFQKRNVNFATIFISKKVVYEIKQGNGKCQRVYQHALNVDTLLYGN